MSAIALAKQEQEFLICGQKIEISEATEDKQHTSTKKVLVWRYTF